MYVCIYIQIPSIYTIYNARPGPEASVPGRPVAPRGQAPRPLLGICCMSSYLGYMWLGVESQQLISINNWNLKFQIVQNSVN